MDEEPFELTFDNAEAYGLAPGDLVADSHGACQDFADRMRREGLNAFIAPSAALPGTRNLVLLGPRVPIAFNDLPLDDIDVPVAMAAQDGRCPEHLWRLVHYRGAGVPHPAYDAWQQGDDNVFAEPEVSADTLTL